MTTTTHSPTAVDDCPVCHGAGEIVTDETDPETGFHGSEVCDWCNGDGTVPAGTSTRCDGCDVPIFVDHNACSHSGEVLCDVCSLERCAECRDDAAGDHSTDVWLELLRGGA